MSRNASSSFRIGRLIAAGLALCGLAAVSLNMIYDNRPKGEVREVPGYTPWPKETISLAESLPVQNGGRVKPLSAYAGFSMLGIHGARSMKVKDSRGETHKIKPTEWMLDALFRPQLALHEPTFRIDNSSVLEAIGVAPRGRRDRYSYNDLEPGLKKLIELAQTYERIDAKQRDPVQQQTIDLAYNVRNYESLLGYFGFARFGVVLQGSGVNGAPDQRADVSSVMLTASHIRSSLQEAQRTGQTLDPRIQNLLEQIFTGSDFAKFGLFLLPPTDPNDTLWRSAGHVISDVMTAESKDPATAIEDIKALERTAKAAGQSESAFRSELGALKDRITQRAESRGEGRRVQLEADYYHRDFFLVALVLFLLGTLSALAMWATGRGKAGRILSWSTLACSVLGFLFCAVAITKRVIIMQRPPVGNLYDTIVFIATTIVLLALLIEWMTRRRFALGIAPILGTLLIVLARRYELGDAKDHMDPLVAVLDSNFWLTIHVITITLGYSAGLLCAMLSCFYLLLRGLRLDDGNRDLQRSLTRSVYGMVCLTLFLSLIGTVLGGIWANYSWGRFWGWDPKENGALMIVLWTLVILHARLGGYIREWGLHFASIFTACIVAFSWWHVNFLGVGLHNYGFTAGKNTIWAFYVIMGLFLLFGVIAMVVEMAQAQKAGTPRTPADKLPSGRSLNA